MADDINDELTEQAEGSSTSDNIAGENNIASDRIAGDSDNTGATDMDSENEAGTDAEAKKPEAAPKQAALHRSAVTRTVRKPVKKNSNKAIVVILVIVIILDILVVGFILEEIYFNSFGTRDIFIDTVMKLDPDYKMREQTLDTREADLNVLQSEMDARERMIASREQQNDRRGVELDGREETIRELEQSPVPIYMRILTDQEISDMIALSRSYAVMAPEAAVAILVELGNPDDVAAILYYMSNKNAAAILAAMDPVFAAAITEILLYN